MSALVPKYYSKHSIHDQMAKLDSTTLPFHLHLQLRLYTHVFHFLNVYYSYLTSSSDLVSYLLYSQRLCPLVLRTLLVPFPEPLFYTLATHPCNNYQI